MDKNIIMKSILDSYPYPIVFVDKEYIIRFLNRYAEYHYYKERGYEDLIGKSLLDCHDTEQGKEKIRQAFTSLQNNGKEIFWESTLATREFTYRVCVMSRESSSDFSNGLN